MRKSICVNTLTLAALLVSVLSVGADVVIDFETLPAGENVYSQYTNLGVTFVGNPRVFEPEVATRSGSKALTEYHPGDEFGHMLAITFSAPQSRVSMFAGLIGPTGGRQVNAELRAYGAGNNLLTKQNRVLGPGPQHITTLMSVQTQNNAIVKVELQYQGGYFATIDDLTFTTAGPAGAPDTIRPQVVIDTPIDGQHIDTFANQGAFTLKGKVIEAVQLKTVTIRVEHDNQVRNSNLAFANGPPVYDIGGPNIHGLIFEGHNKITVTAEDFAANQGSQTIEVWYEPLQGEARLLVLTPTNLRAPLVWLRNWKNMSEMPCHIMSLESIISDGRFSNARDIQERIKFVIRHAYENHGTRYVMLVGDGDTFPVRYTRVGHQGVSWGVCRPASDLYYSDLFKANGSFDSWDTNGDGVYGDWWAPPTEGGAAANFAQINKDNCDLMPDVAIGRVPASTEEEVTNYVAKAVAYELDGPRPWFNNVVMFNGSSDFRNDDGQLNNVASTLLSDFTAKKHYRPAAWNSWTLEQRQTYEAQWCQDIINDINTGAGFVICFDHGANWVMGVLTSGHISQLANQQQNRWPIAIASACDTAKFIQNFDWYMDIDGNMPPAGQLGWDDPRPEPMAIQPAIVDLESMAERWLVFGLNGGVGFLGSHSGTNDASHPYIKLFIGAWQAGHHTLGDMWKYAVTHFVQQYLHTNHAFSRSPFQSHHIHKFCLFGDPSLRVGGIPASALSGVGETVASQLRTEIRQLPSQFQAAIGQLRYPPYSANGIMTITGRAQPGTVVAAYETRRTFGRAGARLAQATADGKGSFRLVMKGLSEGVHLLTIRIVGEKARATARPERILARVPARASTSARKGSVVAVRTVRFEVHLADPTVKDLRYPKTCAPAAFALTGRTQYDSTWVELLEGKQVLDSDYSRHGGMFVLRPKKSLSIGRYSLSLRLKCGAGREVMLRDKVSVSVATAPRKLRVTPGRPTIKSRP